MYTCLDSCVHAGTYVYMCAYNHLQTRAHICVCVYIYMHISSTVYIKYIIKDSDLLTWRPRQEHTLGRSLNGEVLGLAEQLFLLFWRGSQVSLGLQVARSMDTPESFSSTRGNSREQDILTQTAPFPSKQQYHRFPTTDICTHVRFVYTYMCRQKCTRVCGCCT